MSASRRHDRWRPTATPQVKDHDTVMEPHKGSFFPVQRPGQGLEPGLDSRGVPAGQPIDEEAPQGREDHLGDLQLTLLGPVRRADGQQ